jgi:hypothetical protein
MVLFRDMATIFCAVDKFSHPGSRGKTTLASGEISLTWLYSCLQAVEAA